MGLRKLFTLEDRVQIQELLESGYNVSAIAKMVERSKNGVATEVRKNGGPYEYDAAKAQKRSEQVHEDKKETVSKKLKNEPESFGMHRRIIELEKQVAFLSNEIEKIKKGR